MNVKSRHKAERRFMSIFGETLNEKNRVEYISRAAMTVGYKFSLRHLKASSRGATSLMYSGLFLHDTGFKIE